MAKRFGVRATPTFLLVRNARSLRHFHGNIPEPVLRQHLTSYAPPLDETAQETSRTR